jgi:hypothetical protein
MLFYMDMKLGILSQGKSTDCVWEEGAEENIWM